MKLLIIWYMLSSLFCYIASDDEVLCSDTFCKSYLSKNKCNAPPDACRIQNVTHSGVFFPYPGPCNCCDYCLQNLAQGTPCGKGDPTSPQPTTICGPQLTCQLSTSSQATCDRISSMPCVQDQDEYDKARKEGTLGHLQVRATCDRNGMYAPFECVPGEICYCVSEDGRRLFGEIPYTSHAEYLLKCKCSRSYDKELQKVNGKQLLPKSEFLRCQSQGDYDPIQCIGNLCLCTDPEDGHPTYPNAELVNITSIMEITLPCFDVKKHVKGSYYRECELDLMEQLKLITKYKKEGFEVFGYALPNCQLDGYYAPVQEKDNMKYCAAPSGKMLESFEIPITDPLASSMNCNCARARSLIVGEEKPDCCENGNYKQVQCRRGLCRCVNENGVQIEKEVEYPEIQKLKCFKLMCN